jgi:hypothetical protein
LDDKIFGGSGLEPQVGPTVDIQALAARYNDPDFWRKSLEEGEDDHSVC